MRYDNAGDKPYKFYRDHTPDVPIDYKNTSQGSKLDDQSDTGPWTTSNDGDETSWAFWENATRVLGAWSQVFVARVVKHLGYNRLFPVDKQGLTADQTFSPKEIVTTAVVNDHTKVMSAVGTEPEEGDIGLVVQTVNQDEHAQIFIPISSTEQTKYARIRWDFDEIGDYSEGQILQYDSDEDSFSATETLIWIDYIRSRTTRFETAGDQTIFAIKKIKDGVDRKNETRPLYEAVRCVRDEGLEITHLQTTTKTTISITGKILSSATLYPPWDDPVTTKIQTTIGLSTQDNIMLTRIQTEWDLTGGENYAYLEISDFSRGMPFYFRPIRPIMVDWENNTWESAELVGGEIPIAEYRQV